MIAVCLGPVTVGIVVFVVLVLDTLRRHEMTMLGEKIVSRMQDAGHPVHVDDLERIFRHDFAVVDIRSEILRLLSAGHFRITDGMLDLVPTKPAPKPASIVEHVNGIQWQPIALLPPTLTGNFLSYLPGVTEPVTVINKESSYFKRATHWMPLPSPPKVIDQLLQMMEEMKKEHALTPDQVAYVAETAKTIFQKRG